LRVRLDEIRGLDLHESGFLIEVSSDDLTENPCLRLETWASAFLTDFGVLHHQDCAPGGGCCLRSCGTGPGLALGTLFLLKKVT
jgi:hypothetical protein